MDVIGSTTSQMAIRRLRIAEILLRIEASIRSKLGSIRNFEQAICCLDTRKDTNFESRIPIGDPIRGPCAREVWPKSIMNCYVNTVLDVAC